METIIRVVKDLDADPFARIDKVPINATDISFKALGILTYLLSKPDGWDTRISQLIKAKTDREKSVRSGIKELVDQKHILRIRVTNSKGRIVKWSYIVYERPYLESYPEDYISLVLDSPLSQNGNMDDSPLSLIPQVDNPQVDNPQVDKVPPINKVLNKQQIKITKEKNNNNTTDAEDLKNVVVEIPKKERKKYLKLEKRIKNLGWVGSVTELKNYYMDDPKYLTAWTEKIESIKGLNNPAGLLRKGLRSGDRPTTAREIELNKLIEIGLDEKEAEAML